MVKNQPKATGFRNGVRNRQKIFRKKYMNQKTSEQWQVLMWKRPSTSGILSLVTGCRFDVDESAHPESCIRSQSGKHMVGLVLWKVDGIQSQNLVHGANQGDTDPKLPALTYQQEVEFDNGLDHGWSTWCLQTWQKNHLRLQNWITCVSGSLASPRVHLRLRFWITCTSKLPGASDIIHHVREGFLSLMLTVARDPNVEVQAIQIWRYKRSKFGVKP